MKILFDNLLWDATLSALHADAGYPVTNLRHFFLKKLFKSTAVLDTVTIEFAEDESIDCCYLALTNAATATLKLYNAAMGLLATKTIDIATLAVSFAAVSGVRYATIELTATSPALVYLGTAALGVAYAMPDPRHDWKAGYVDNSVASESAGGQYLVNKASALRAYDLNFFVQDFADYLEIFALVTAVERPVFVDLLEGARTTVLPMYSILDGGITNYSKDHNVYRFSLRPREVR
jgi:hypothetical protein